MSKHNEQAEAIVEAGRRFLAAAHDYGLSDERTQAAMRAAEEAYGWAAAERAIDDALGEPRWHEIVTEGLPPDGERVLVSVSGIERARLGDCAVAYVTEWTDDPVEVQEIDGRRRRIAGRSARVFITDGDCPQVVPATAWHPLPAPPTTACHRGAPRMPEEPTS